MNDPLRVSPGTDFDKIDAEAALEACNNALAANANEPHLLFNRSRAYAKRAENAAKAEDKDRENAAGKSATADLDAAIKAGYPVAFNNLAGRHERGEGVKKDEAKAADLYLEYFNRTLYCCLAPIARDLITPAGGRDASESRRVAGALLSWSAALGSTASRDLLAELVTEGTLPATDPAPAATFTDLPPWLRD